MSIKITVQPTIEPITLSEAKTHLKVDEDDFDVEINNLITQGRQHVENVTGRALITQTWEYKLDGFKTCMKIPRPPLQSVSSIQYQDASDATQTLGASNYTIDSDSEPGRIVESPTGNYPSTYEDLNAVTVTFVAGYGDAASDVPEVFKQAIKLYVERMFDMPVASYGDALDNALMSMIIHYKVDNISL